MAEEEEEEQSTVAEKPTMPRKPVLRTRTRAVAGEETKTRKRKSLMTCENAVSKRLQFWKGKETSDTDIDSSSLTLNSPMKERKPESLVKKIFKQQVKKTEDEDDTPQSNVQKITLTVVVASSSSIPLSLVDVPLCRARSIHQDSSSSSSIVTVVLSTNSRGQDEGFHRE